MYRKALDLDGQNGALCSCISDSGRLFAVCDTNKILRIFKSDKDSWSLLKEQYLCITLIRLVWLEISKRRLVASPSCPMSDQFFLVKSRVTLPAFLLTEIIQSYSKSMVRMRF